VPLASLTAILGDNKHAEIIVKEISQIESFSMDKLQKKFKDIQFFGSDILLNNQVAIAKMTKLHKLANRLRRYMDMERQATGQMDG